MSDLGAIDDFTLFDNADRKTGQIVFAVIIEAGHLGGFASGQCAAGQLAAMGNAFNDALGHIHIQLTCGVVVQKQEGFCADYEYIVHAHGHKVLADAVVPVVVYGQF